MIKFKSVVFLALLLAGCSGHVHESDKHMHEHSHEHGEEANSDEIVIEPEDAATLGIKTSVVELKPFQGTVKTTGEIIVDPAGVGIAVAPTNGEIKIGQNVTLGMNVKAGQVLGTVTSKRMAGGDAVAAARIELNAAKAELERLKPLAESGIVTRRELNEAQAAYDKALNAVSSSRGNSIAAPMSGTISDIMVANGQYVNAGDPIAAVSAPNSTILRADIPKHLFHQLKNAMKASFTVTGSDGFYEATVVSNNPAASSAKGFEPVYFSIKDGKGLTAGTFAEVYLHTGDTNDVIAVPMGAVSERFGQKFVYVRLDEECYQRRPVRIGASDGQSVEITEGLNPGENVVTEGMTFVRLAETKGSVPEGHTHNH